MCIRILRVFGRHALVLVFHVFDLLLLGVSDMLNT